MQQGRSMVKSILLGAATGAAAAVGLSLIAAALISGERLPMESAPLVGAMILMVGAFCGARTSAKLQGGKTLLSALTAALCIMATALVMKAAFFGGWSAHAVMGSLGSTGAAVAAALLPVGRKRGRARY